MVSNTLPTSPLLALRRLESIHHRQRTPSPSSSSKQLQPCPPFHCCPSCPQHQCVYSSPSSQQSLPRPYSQSASDWFSTSESAPQRGEWGRCSSFEALLGLLRNLSLPYCRLGSPFPFPFLAQRNSSPFPRPLSLLLA